MVYLYTAKFAVVILTLGIAGIAGTNLVFADQPCGEQPYIHNVACMPLGQAQIAALAIVGGIIALAIGCGAFGIKHHLMH